MSELADFLNEQPNLDISFPLLPIIHSCECFDARSILRSHKLEARFCKVFNKKLLYFYYGKPSYPVGEKSEGYRADFEYAPACFILNIQNIYIYIHKVFPFDSGAFFTDKYRDFLHRSMKIENFELECSTSGIRKYISYMYGNNESYYDGIAKELKPTGRPCIDGLVNMSTASGTMKFDERARTIEILSKKSVPIQSAVKCIILPQNLLQDKGIVSFLDANNIEYYYYKVRQLTHPTSYYSKIVEMVETYLEEKGGLR